LQPNPWWSIADDIIERTARGLSFFSGRGALKAFQIITKAQPDHLILVVPLQFERGDVVDGPLPRSVQHEKPLGARKTGRYKSGKCCMPSFLATAAPKDRLVEAVRVVRKGLADQPTEVFDFVDVGAD
jgi:hypothetical protein